MDIKRDLVAEMAKDSIIIEYLKDKEIAADFYRALCNIDWYAKIKPIPEDERIIEILIGDKEEPWTCSWRAAGGHIADIRNMHYNVNEDYLDFYCSGREGTVAPLVLECLDRIGWRPVLF